LDIIDYQIVVEIPGFTQFEKFGIAISTEQPIATAYFGVNTTTQIITDTNSFQLESLKIYPNPVVRFVNVEVGKSITTPYSILVYNLDGELLIHQIATASKTILDFSKLPAGSYLIQVCSGIERQSSTVIKR
jgi:Secretion system C-terminal sorting domain